MFDRVWRWACLAGCAVPLAGCYAPAPAPLVVLPGQQKSYQQFQADDAACRPDAAQTGNAYAGTASGPTTTVSPNAGAAQYASTTGQVDLSATPNLAYVQCMAAHGNNVAPVPRAYPYPAYTYGYTSYYPWAWGPAYWGWPGYYGLAVGIAPWYGAWWGSRWGGWHGGWGGWHGGWAGGGGWRGGWGGAGNWGHGNWGGGTWGGGRGGWGGGGSGAGGWGGGGGFHGGGGRR